MNEAIQWVAGHFGGWVTETSGAQLTVASDIYALPAGVLRVNDVRLKKTTDTYWPTSSLPQQQLEFLQIDGLTGQPTMWALKSSASASSLNTLGLVFYKYPDATYDIRVGYNYTPVMSQSSTGATVPVPSHYEPALRYMLCAKLMSKSSVNKKGQRDSAYYEGLAIRAMGQPILNDVNRSARNTRGYIS